MGAQGQDLIHPNLIPPTCSLGLQFWRPFLQVLLWRVTLCSISAIFSSMVEVLVIITGITTIYDGENDETGWVKGTSFLKFLITGEELIKKVFVRDDSLLISKSFEVNESLVAAFLFARESKEMTVWSWLSLVGWGWSRSRALDQLRVIGPT